MNSKREVAEYVQFNKRSLYTTWTFPLKRSQAGILFIPPILDERYHVWRFTTELSQECARFGGCSLRFDFSGSGESEGASSQSNLESWKQETKFFLDQLQERVPEGPIFIIGIRLGAALSIDFLGKESSRLRWVLVEPIWQGEKFTKEIKRKRAIRDKLTSGTSGDQNQNDFDGYELSESFLEQIASLQVVPYCLKGLWLQCGASDKISPSNQRLLENDKIMMKIVPIRIPPFWNSIDLVDFNPVLTQITSWMNSQT